MIRKRILTVLIGLILLACVVSAVSAASLRFRVDQSGADIYIGQDGTATVVYSYHFINDASGAPIDAVDIGLPTSQYNIANVKADVDGSPVTDITDSPYVKPGIALNLHSLTLAPGAQGTLQVSISGIRNLIYKTNKVQNVQKPYASFQYSPNSFGSDYVYGNTNLTVTLHLPPGLKSEEPRWFTPQNFPGKGQPETGIDDQGNAYYRWQSAQANSSTQYIFGAAFPARLVPASVLMSESPLNLSKFSWDSVCPWIFCAGFFGFLGLVIYGSVTADKKRRLQYLPPKIALEGNGIKRGLTAVEAAILMEQPLDKILSMMLFSVVKKGAAVVVTKTPLKIQKTNAAGLQLYDYETGFIDAMTADNPGATRTGLQNMMVNLVKSISEKMRGFSRRETIAYYQDIMKKAWEQVESAGTPEVQMQRFDDAMDWTMLDQRFEDRSRTIFSRGPVFVPIWWGRYDPGFGRGASLQTPSAAPSQVGSAPGGVNLPSLPGADFAASIAGGIQNFSSGVVGDITNFTSGVTKTTNPPPASSSNYRPGSGGGGRSCACACACACAGCACACAGGGR